MTTPADERAQLWGWHSFCVEKADEAKRTRNMAEWHKWSQAAAEILEKLA